MKFVIYIAIIIGYTYLSDFIVLRPIAAFIKISK